MKEIEEELKRILWGLLRSMEFRCGRTNMNDAKPPRRLNDVTAEKFANKINDILLNDHHQVVYEISKLVNISDECVFRIFHKHVGMRIILARWVSRLLTVDHKSNCN